MILIKGGKVVTPEKAQERDVLIDEKTGKIVRVAPRISPTGARIVRANGLVVLPGAIDGHVHFRDPEDITKEDFSSGTASALAGGVTTIIDMPCYRNPATTTPAAYEAKRRLAKRRCRCDYQVRFGASEHNVSEAAESGAQSLKIFLAKTGSELDCSKKATSRHFAAFPRKKPICVHAEDSERIAARSKRYTEHEKVRDKIAAQLSCEFALREAAKTYRRVHICHVTTAREIELCRQHGNATYEINPAHLYLSIDDLVDLGFLGKLNPPLRDRTEQAKLWRKVSEDTIIASDHAPHLPKHKKAGAPGVPGVGTLLPLMLHAVHQRKISLPLLARISAFNPSSAFNLHEKGEITEGKDADIVLVDMGRKWRISAKNRLSRCGWTPFEGMEVYGKIEAVYLRGKLAYDGAKVRARAGFGKEAQ